MKRVLILLARAWQWGPSRILPPTCRYAPSCSEYAIEALQRHGVADLYHYNVMLARAARSESRLYRV